MGDKLEKFIEKYSAKYAFFNSGESIESAGADAIDNDSVKQAIVVLKQSLDTAEISGIEKIAFYSSDSKLTFLFRADDVYGILTETDVKDIALDGGVGSDDKNTKSKIVLKERKKIAVKSQKTDEKEDSKKQKKKSESKNEKEINGKKSEEKILNYKLDNSVIDDVRNIAAEYLDDFAEDIVNNMIKDSKLNINELTGESISVFLKKLSKSSSLIIGPSSANEMIDKINKKITE